MGAQWRGAFPTCCSRPRSRKPFHTAFKLPLSSLSSKLEDLIFQILLQVEVGRTSSSWHQHIPPLPPSHTNRELLLIPENNPLLQQLLTWSKEILFQRQRIQLIHHRSDSHLLQHLLAVPRSTAAYIYPFCTAAPYQLLITTLCSINITCAATTPLPAAPPTSGTALSIPPFHTRPISPLFLSFLLQPVIGTDDSPHI